MFTDLDGYNSIWTAFSLIILFGMIPVVLFVLSKAATIANSKQSQENEARELTPEEDAPQQR